MCVVFLPARVQDSVHYMTCTLMGMYVLVYMYISTCGYTHIWSDTVHCTHSTHSGTLIQSNNHKITLVVWTVTTSDKKWMMSVEKKIK